MEAHGHALAEQHVEVHKFYAGVVTIAVILALLLEAFRKEPFPLVRRRFSERTGAVTGAPVLGAATRNP